MVLWFASPVKSVSKYALRCYKYSNSYFMSFSCNIISVQHEDKKVDCGYDVGVEGLNLFSGTMQG